MACAGLLMPDGPGLGDGGDGGRVGAGVLFGVAVGGGDVAPAKKVGKCGNSAENVMNSK